MVLKEPGERPTKERHVYVQNSDDGVTNAVSIGALVLLAALVLLMFMNYDSLKSWTQQTVPQTQTQMPIQVPTNTVIPVPIPYPVPGQTTTVERDRIVPVPTLAPPAPTNSTPETAEPPANHFGDGDLTTPVTPPTDTTTSPSTSTGGN